MQQKLIETGEEYKYLDTKISNDGIFEPEIREINAKGRRSISLLNCVLWDQSILKEAKTRMYSTIAKTITTYGSKVWTIGGRIKRALEVSEMDFLWRSVGRSRLEIINNARIR